ncbi:NUDIX domain-containing protein [Patescibacteria group bacterium]|nr:NUDIX domain-containing protein [Patescibacteria group bacterium]MBU1922137.1 NUDIX domain-containing protein [Patescibacteria group bacterium]
MFTIGTFAIIFDQQKRALLCHRRDYDIWNLPGGHVEKNESPWQAVIREVKEEVGLGVEVDRMAGVYSKPEVEQIIFTFICKITGGKLTLTDEADKIEYFEFDNIPKNISPNHVERIKDALEHGEETIFKIQQNYKQEDLEKL